MITLFRILLALILHPFSYGILNISTKELLIVASGKHKELQSFQDLLTKRHFEHLQQDSTMGLTTKDS